MRGRLGKIMLIACVSMSASGCATLEGKPNHVIGMWGGPHAALEFDGGLADARFDCASGTIDDPIYVEAEGPFSAKGTYRTGPAGPVRVGQYFKSQGAVFSGHVDKNPAKNGPRVMTLNVELEDGTHFGPFTLTEGAPPQLTHCA